MKNTYCSLYDTLLSLPDTTIYSFLNKKASSYEKQEALFRLFAYLKLIPEFNDYEVCDGNFNLGTIKKNSDKTLLFNANLKDKGDSADLKLISKDNDSLIIATSKNLSHMSVNGFDLTDIEIYFNDHYKKEYDMKICIVVNSKVALKSALEQSEETSKRNKNTILNSIIFDWDDINCWYQHFIVSYKKPAKTIDNILHTVKGPIIHRPHGLYAIRKILSLKEEKYKNALLGMIQRSGKTYIIGGVCTFATGSNYLIITTAPNDTIHQYISLFQNHLEFEDFNIIQLNGSNVKPKRGLKNIVICSKQFLQSKVEDEINEDETKVKVKQIKWLKEMVFDFRFIDESHNGGSTTIAKKILDTYGTRAFSVYVTATYIKPVKVYDIPQEAHITWNTEDIKLCKTINQENKKRLIEKHGNIMSGILEMYTDKQIIETYSIFPDLHLMTFDFKDNVKNAIIQKYKDRIEGFSTDAIFLLKQVKGECIDVFQDDEKVLDLCYTIFGKTESDGLFTDEWDSILKRIINMCNNANINSRTFTTKNPLSIIAFLPTGNINKLQTALKNLIVKHNILPDFEIVCLCGEINGGKKSIDCINDAMSIVKNKKKKGLLILTGTMCSLGVSLPHCDIALMLNNSEGGDQYFQMIYRSMTEEKGKKCGFVIDLNLQRITSVLVDYALKITSDKKMTVKESIKYVLKQQLIGFNSDEWMHNYFGLTSVNVEKVIDRVYALYSSRPNNAIDNILKDMENKMNALNCISSNDQKLFNTIFHSAKDPKTVTEAIEELTKNSEIKKGIEKIPIEENEEKTKSTVKENRNVNIIKDVLKHLLPLMCLLTVHNINTTTFIEMCQFIENADDEKNVLITQLSSWWGKTFANNRDVINIFIIMYNNYLKDDMLFNTTVMRLKEMFCIAKNNRNELSKLIDSYLVPHEIEKKQNAEISTPYALRQEMLNSIPKNFWLEKSHCVFEPCAGKGGFLLDIVALFEEGLKTQIFDIEKRYKHIVENCLYWSDINPVNIWICRLLLDPFGRYDLKFNLGDTLLIDIKEKWDINGFDAVIGNPPYQENDENGKSKGGTNMYTKFINFSFNVLLENGYLTFITPISWLGPSTNTQMGNNILHNIFLKYDLIHLNLNECKKHFKVGSTFSYYTIKKSINSDVITKITSEYKKIIEKSEINLKKYNCLKFLPIHITTETLELVSSVIKNTHKLLIERSRKLDTSTKYGKTHLKLEEDETFKYITFHTTTKLYYSDIKLDLHDEIKILLNMSGYLKPEICLSGNVTESKYYIKTTKNDAEMLINLLNSSRIQKYLELCKYSGFNSRPVLENISYDKLE
jgi:hypothetical protein